MEKKQLGNSDCSIDEKGFVFFVNKDGKLIQIGQLFEKQFICTRKKKHIFIKYKALGFNHSLIKEGGIENIKVNFYDGRILCTTSKELLQRGIIDSYKGTKNEEQIFLPIAEFSVN